MLLHIGANHCVALDKLLLVVNARGMPPRARGSVERARQDKRYTACDRGEPKSYVFTDSADGTRVYGTMISSETLEKRWRQTLRAAVLGETLWRKDDIELSAD